MGQADDLDICLESLSPLAWRLLRVAAEYEQREVEDELDDILQAHISMLENNNRSLSQSQLEQLFSLYASHLESEQILAITKNY